VHCGVAREATAGPSASRIYLVSCVSQKRDQACPAQGLHVSDWFRKARRYAETSGCPWFVLSAEYGLVPPNRVIDPYERTLNTMPVVQRRAWAERVVNQLAAAVPGLTEVVLLAGERYREARYRTERGITVSVPLAGLRIGEQLSWLGQHLP
jgi:hypothetical protein